MFFVNYKKLYSKICSDLTEDGLVANIKNEVVDELIEKLLQDKKIFKEYFNDDYYSRPKVTFCEKIANLILKAIDSKINTNNLDQNNKVEDLSVKTVNQYIAKENFIDNIVDRILKKQIGR